jgi:hypothetical protein
VRPRAFILPTLVLAALFAAASPALCLIEAGALKPVLEVLKNDPYLDGQHPAQDPRKQFLVYAKNAQRAQEVLQVVVQRRHQAQQFFQTSVIWRDPALVLVYPNEITYLRSGGQYGSAGQQAQGRFHGTGAKVKLVMTYEGKDMLGHTLPHELMHLLITDMSNRGYYDGHRNEVMETPIWTQEGIAEFMTADALRRGNFERFVYWSLHEGKMMGLERMLRRVDYDRQHMVLHYAQSYSFVAFIAATVPNGRQRLRNFIVSFDDPDRAKDPLRTFEMAFQGVAPSIEVLERRWHIWIDQQYAHHFPPVVVKTLPTHESEDASTDGKIWVKFDRPIDRGTLSAATTALRKGSTKTLGDDKDNLLRRAILTWSKDGTVLLIEARDGFDANSTYTLVLSDHVKDTEGHGLAAGKFAIMETDDWWKESTIEPTPKDKGSKGTTTPKTTTPKAVSTLTFKTKTGD